MEHARYQEGNKHGSDQWRRVASQLVDWIALEPTLPDTGPEHAMLVTGLVLLLRQVLLVLKVPDGAIWTTIDALAIAVGANDAHMQRCELEALEALLRNL